MSKPAEVRWDVPWNPSPVTALVTMTAIEGASMIAPVTSLVAMGR